MPIDHLALDGVSVSFTDTRVLTDVSLTAPPGERVGVVGENGAGKSTLLRVAAGDLTPSAGGVTSPERVGLLHQELPHPASDTVGDVLEAAVAPVRWLAERGEQLGAALAERPDDRRAAAEFAHSLHEAELAHAWSLDARIHEVVAGLGIADVPRSRRLAEISGGQRRRLALAALLLGHPTLLVLDEPTNHLDDAGLDFLAAHLDSWGGPVLFASHDRAFLDRVATRIVDLDPTPGPDGDLHQGAVYTGAYSDYLRTRVDDRRRWQERYDSEQHELARLRHTVDVAARDVFHRTTAKSEARIAAKFYGDRAATTIGRRVRSARTQLDRLEAAQVAPPPQPLAFTGFRADERAVERRAGGDERTPRGTGDEPAPPPLTLRGAAVAGRLAPLDLTLAENERLLVTGPNGCGKSTLLAVLAGTLAPTCGDRAAGEGVRIGLLAQDVTAAVAGATTTAADLFEHHGLTPPRGLLYARDIRRPLRELSLGTQRRVELALLVADPPDVLLLDEPTNHLALSLVEELEAALPEYPGAVVVASHDPWLRARWRGRELRLPVNL
ncbi:MAG: ABC-F family ATP-binding cassette domain-containing protein [Dermatophilus congolensis]|nr:ABC-F family ATP-binding cassette domain-containing protein [Dermatophilus congolensis]